MSAKTQKNGGPPPCGSTQKLCQKTPKPLKPGEKYRWVRWLFPITGLLALIWFLVRVIPKPSRAEYPCQRVAMPLASGFIVWLLGVLASAAAFHRAKRLFHKSRYVVAAVCLVVGVLAVYWPMCITGRWAEAAGEVSWYVPLDAYGVPQPNNVPVGVARGVYPGRVTWAYDTNATSWDGSTGSWWDYLDQDTVDEMVSNSIQDVSGATNDSDAWDSIFKYFNQAHGKGELGYQSPEKIAVKLNCNTIKNDHSDPDNANAPFPAPEIVLALLRQLVYNAGVDANCITLYDAIRLVPDQIYIPCHTEFPEVIFVDYNGGDGRTQRVRDTSCQVYWSDDLLDPTEDPENGPQDTYLPKCVSDANYIINMAVLKGHGTAGMTVCAKNHFGSLLAGPGGPDDMSTPGFVGAHPYIVTNDNKDWPKRPMGAYNALVDLMGHKDLGGKTLLFMVDALYTAPKQSEPYSDSYKWQSAPFNDDWCASIFISLDGVAVDSVALDFMRNETVMQSWPNGMCEGDTIDNYLHEAAEANDPPSGTFYDPDNDGNVARLDSLGVHEHWSNAADKQYSRNLGTADGIELISSPIVYSAGGDINGGGVNFEDLDIISEHWLNDDCKASNGWCLGADLNKNGKVNFSDYALLAIDWLK